MVSLSPLTVVPEWAKGVFTLGTRSRRGGWSRNQSGWDPSPLAASIVSPDLELVEKVKTAGWTVGVDGDQAKQPPLYFPNLYPPLTPVPQCVVEIRATGQSPIHRHPEYFKVKPHRLTKKVLLIKGLPSRPSLSPSVDARSPGSGIFTYRRKVLEVSHFSSRSSEVGHCGLRFVSCPAQLFESSQCTSN